MAVHRIACHKCQNAWSYEGPLGRRDECPQCRADAKVCLNCRHFDQGAHHECREEQAEWVKEKAHGNFCSYFEPLGAHEGASAQDSAKAKLEALFGGSTSDSPAKKPGEDVKAELARFLADRRKT